MGTKQCAVVMSLSKSKLWLRGGEDGVGSVADRGRVEDIGSYKESWGRGTCEALDLRSLNSELQQRLTVLICVIKSRCSINDELDHIGRCRRQHSCEQRRVACHTRVVCDTPLCPIPMPHQFRSRLSVGLALGTAIVFECNIGSVLQQQPHHLVGSW